MTKTERAHVALITSQADTLMNVLPSAGHAVRVTNSDIIEAMLSDLARFGHGLAPTHLAALIAIDGEGN
jgi:hypothetical protein